MNANKLRPCKVGEELYLFHGFTQISQIVPPSHAWWAWRRCCCWCLCHTGTTGWHGWAGGGTASAIPRHGEGVCTVRGGRTK